MGTNRFPESQGLTAWCTRDSFSVAESVSLLVVCLTARFTIAAIFSAIRETQSTNWKLFLVPAGEQTCRRV